MSNDVVFRRVRGRIIPIRKTAGAAKPSPGRQRTTKAAAGAAMVGGGVATAGFAGRFAAKSVIAAAILENSARGTARSAQEVIAKMKRAALRAPKTVDQLEFGFKKAVRLRPNAKFQKLNRKALIESVAAEKLFRSRKYIRSAGTAIGGAMIGVGLKKLYEAGTGKPADTKADVISSAAGLTAAFATRAGYQSLLMNGKRFSWAATKAAFKAIRLVR